MWNTSSARFPILCYFSCCWWPHLPLDCLTYSILQEWSGKATPPQCPYCKNGQNGHLEVSLVPSPPSQMRCSRRPRLPFQLLPEKKNHNWCAGLILLPFHSLQNVTTEVGRAGCALCSTLHWLAVHHRVGFFLSEIQINLHVSRKRKKKQTHNQKTYNIADTPHSPFHIHQSLSSTFIK